jgi:hypothetical protein
MFSFGCFPGGRLLIADCIKLPKKMEPVEGFETSAISNQMPGKHPKENILYVKHGESLKSRKVFNTYM